MLNNSTYLCNVEEVSKIQHDHMKKKKYNANVPYNELTLLPPKIELSASIFMKTIAANKALAELKGMAELIPNQSIIINTLILQEAKDSSEVENIVTTHDDLYKAFGVEGSTIDPAVKEVMNYRQALWHGYQTVKKKQLITVRDIVKIQEILVGNAAGVRKQPGTALRNARTGEVIYTPPLGKEVLEKLLRNLEQYINLDKYRHTDPLIKMAIMHYQFESIHPFYDGNGRTGRMINVLYLILEDLLDLPILYLSSYIIKNKKKYYDGLNDVRIHGNWDNWIIFMLDSVEQTSKDTMGIIKNIRAVSEQAMQDVKKKKPKIYSKELIDAIFTQPYCRITTLEETLGISRFTASKYLKALEEIGWMKAERVGRDMLYINLPLISLFK